MLYDKEITSSLSVILAKWKEGYIRVKSLFLFKGKEFYVREGTVDQLYCSLNTEYAEQFITKEDMGSSLYNYMSYFRHCKHNLKYKKLFYLNTKYSSITLGEFFGNKLEYLYLCQLSGAEDFYYTEPEWYNGR